ncbi:MAG: outer membrane protein assembly factor BamB family protein, partial [Isosphaeraceae bacterium]
MRSARSHGFSEGLERIGGPVCPGSCRRISEGRAMGGINPAVTTAPAGRISRTIAWLLVALMAIATLDWRPVPAVAQGPSRNASNFKPDDSEDALIQLRNAANQARDGQWSEAVDLYQRVIDRYAGKVVKVPRDQPGADPTDSSQLFVDARRYCHRLIAGLPAEARVAYRNRMDQLAGRWYREGAAARDPRQLRRVVDQAFCSAWGDDALELLGDLAFQEGRFAEALGDYSQLVPDHADDPALLIHPDPSVDLARVAAKRWLCRAGMGHPPARADLDAFAKAHPGAKGTLAGRTGPYAEILAQAVARDRLELPSEPDGRWPTFAGSPERTRVVPGPIDVGQVQWRIELDKVSSIRAPGARFPRIGLPNDPVRPEQLLAFHPIVLGDQVVICDGSRVTAYHLGDRPAGSDTGDARPVSPAWRHDPENGDGLVRATRSSGVIPRYTLTASGHRIYARMGQSSTSVQRVRGLSRFEAGTSSIVALDWSSQGKLLWERRAIDLELPEHLGMSSRTLNFEGTPVADGRSVFAAATDRGQETMLYVACLDAETGEPRWIRRVGGAQPEADQIMGGFGMPMNNVPTPGDFRHRLLSLDGSRVYYQTNLGAVVALDAETGATQWVASYPRKDPNRLGQSTDRDLNPAVIHDGRVLVAPADADSILAFDAATGRLLWKTEAIADDIKLAHVLGVAQGRLVVTGDRVVLLDVATGKVVGSWPDAANKSHEGYGRGLLAGDLIYWPTKTQIEVLDQRTALRTAPPIKLQEVYHTRGGNLVAGD